MRYPVTNSNEQLTTRLCRAFIAANAPDIDAVYRVDFTGGDGICIAVAHGHCESRIVQQANSTVRLQLDSERTFWQLLKGELDLMSAFIEGKLRSDGHLILAVRFFSLFDRDKLG